MLLKKLFHPKIEMLKPSPSPRLGTGWISESPLITAHLSKPLWEADLHVNEGREKKKDYQNSSRISKELRIENFLFDNALLSS